MFYNNNEYGEIFLAKGIREFYNESTKKMYIKLKGDTDGEF